jgi:hypothetical protein
MVMPPRRRLPPWTVEGLDACFVVMDSTGMSHFLCDLRHTPDADHYRNLMPWVGLGMRGNNR